jgi:AmmeMemoRadiSam system protein A
MIEHHHADDLLRFIRARIAEEMGGPRADRLSGEHTERPGATFVTLRWPDGSLQGCIGSITPRRTLAEDVEQNALASAFEDRRGVSLVPGDVAVLVVELSVLSALERVEFDGSEASAAAALRPGVDGVVLSWRGRRATFLPQVWESYPHPRKLLVHLKMKMGLPGDFWAEDIEISRYTVAKFEDAPRMQAFA